MRLPRPVKIGAHPWAFKRMATPAPEGAPYDGDDHGCCDFDSQTIFIAPRVARKGGSLLAETVLHEVQHAINQHGGVADGATEEHFTTQSAMGWTQVLQDNPHLLAYLSQLLHPTASPAPAGAASRGTDLLPPAPSRADPRAPQARATS